MILVRAYRWMKIAETKPTVRNVYFFSMVISIAGLINMLLPLGIGELFRAQQLKLRKKIAFGQSLSTIIVERFFDIIFLFICGILMSFFIPFPYEIRLSIFIIGLIIILFVVFIFFTKEKSVYSFLNNLTFKNRILRLVHKFINSMIIGFSKFRQSPEKHLIVISTIGFWVLSAGVVYVKGMMLGLEFPIFTILASMFLVNLAIVIPAAPGMFGTYHGAIFLSLHTLSGFSVQNAEGYALFAHGANYIIMIFFGCLFILLNGLKNLVKNNLRVPKILP